MSRFHLALAAMAVLLLVGSYLAFSETLPESEGPLDLRRSRGSGDWQGPLDGGPIGQREPIRSDPLAPDPAADEVAETDEDIEDEVYGALAGTVVTEDGEDPGILGIAFAPQGGLELKNRGGEFEVVRLRPGSYRVTFWGADYIPVSRHDIQIQAGKRKRVELALRRGVRPRGRVIDETDQTGIGGALITFKGGLRCRSDAGGTFEAPHVIAKEELGEITLRHPEYDDIVLRNLPAQDADSMILAMSRGNSFLEVRLINQTGDPLPGRGRIRLERLQGGSRRHLKRESFFDPNAPHLFRRIHTGNYRVTVDFPDAAFAQRSRDVTVDRREDTIRVDIEFKSGTRLEGRLKSLGAVVASRRVELITNEGFVMASTTSKPDGSFVLPGIESGTYRLKVWVGLPCFTTPELRIEGKAPKTVVVDVDKKLFVK